MQNATKKDALLVSAKVLTVFVRAALVIGMVGVGVAMSVLALSAVGWLPADFNLEASPDFNEAPLGLAASALFAVLITIGLVYDFVARLAQIIDTVGFGDPFVIENAHRLTRMAWLALAVQGTSLVADVLGGWAEQQAADDRFSFESEASMTGLALALVLFILARVFREGARMRTELEGTV